MSSFITEENIKVEPVDAFWGTRQSTPVTLVADVAGSLGGKYFDLPAFNSAYSEVEYYAWFNVDAGSVDPAPAGKTGIEVAISSGDAASVVALALKTALEAHDSFRAVAVVAELATIEHEYFGEAVSAADVDAGVTIGSIVLGRGGKLGASQDLELSFEMGAVDVVASQTGEQILDRIMNAKNVTLSGSFEEVTRLMYEQLIGDVSGDKLTPAAGTEVIGVGESKRFHNLKQYAGELILQPVGASDKLRNHNFWKAVPEVESVNFSGSELQVMPITFSAFRDTAKDPKINIWAFGDGSQDLSV